MKVVLLEGLGVSEQVIEQHARKLESMGHTFVAYPKNTDPLVQAEWSRDADVIMLANMPLAPVVLEEAKNLKFIDVALPAWTTSPWRRRSSVASPSATPPAMPPRPWRSCASAS